MPSAIGNSKIRERQLERIVCALRSTDPNVQEVSLYRWQQFFLKFVMNREKGDQLANGLLFSIHRAEFSAGHREA